MVILKLAIKALGIFTIATLFGIEGIYLGYGLAAKEEEEWNLLSKDNYAGKQILNNRHTAAKHLDEVTDTMSSAEKSVRNVINFRTEIQES